MRIIVHMNRAGKRAFRRRFRKWHDAQERQRYLIVLRLADGWSSVAIAQALTCARATVRRVARRYTMPWEEAGTRHLWGRALLEADDRTRAVEKLDASLDIYRRHGAGSPWLERVLEAASAAG